MKNKKLVYVLLVVAAVSIVVTIAAFNQGREFGKQISTEIGK